MAGHNKWAQIKHKKAITDAKRAKNWSKLLAAITAASKSGDPNPDFNPRLRSAVRLAKEEQVPAETIERAIKKGLDKTDTTQEIFLEAYGPGGAAIIITAVTDNTNRTVPQIKKILSDRDGKWAERGSVLWAFEQDKETRQWQARFTQPLQDEQAEKMLSLLEELENHEEIQEVVTNISEEE